MGLVSLTRNHHETRLGSTKSTQTRGVAVAQAEMEFWTVVLMLLCESEQT